jgi:sterol desaturase/sphingolipid hydroxylase (fatty acid hydroxylase superfamily)
MLLARPKIVPIVAAFLFAAAAISLVVAATLLFPNTRLDRIWDLNRQAHKSFLALGASAALVMVLLAAGTLTAAVGLLQRKRLGLVVQRGSLHVGRMRRRCKLVPERRSVP